MATDAQDVLDICSDLAHRLTLLKNCDDRNWFDDRAVRKCLARLEGVAKTPPVAFVVLKRGTPALGDSGILQAFQQRLNEAVGLREITVVALRSLTGEIIDAVPVKCRFRPSSILPDGRLGESAANGLEANLARGISRNAGHSATLMHLEAILTRDEWNERHLKPIRREPNAKLMDELSREELPNIAVASEQGKCRAEDQSLIDAHAIASFLCVTPKVIRKALIDMDCKPAVEGSGMGRGKRNQWPYSVAIQALKHVDTGTLKGKADSLPDTAHELHNLVAKRTRKDSSKIPKTRGT